MSGLFDDAEVISAYTREQALADGTLQRALDLVPDEPNFCDDAGLHAPVALTDRVARIVIPGEKEREYGQDVKGRLWDLLNMARLYRPRPLPPEGATWRFPVIFYCDGQDFEGTPRAEQTAGSESTPGLGPRHRTFHLSCYLGPGDRGEPVITIMFPDEL